MCGRTSCHHDVNTIKKKCTFQSSSNVSKTPTWKDSSNGHKYMQSYNISPGQITPVLFVADDNSESSDNVMDNRIIQPMRWGLIPSFFSGKLEDFKFSTHNARIDTVLKKPSFSKCLKNGHRCIILIDGFYEWKPIEGQKQPYYIHTVDGDKLIYLAGVYDILRTPDGDLYSYTILTEDAQGKIKDIHSRCPVILRDELEISLWLDYQKHSAEQAIHYFMKRDWTDDNLETYPVSTLVNASSNNDPKCIVKMETKDEKPSGLAKWLIMKPKDESSPKKPKLEEVKDESK